MSRNILIVDDSSIERKIIGQAIKNRIEGVNIFECDNGVNIAEELIKNNIHLCILDIMMPEKNGFEILEEIKKDTYLNEIPVIVYTGISDKKAIEKALILGAYDYFTKPLNEEEIKISLPLKAKNAIDHMKRKEELVKKESEIYKLAYHNSITGLPNRNMFREIISNLIKYDDYVKEKFVIIYIDLDNFKEINDAYGHVIGDSVLSLLSQRMRVNESENCKVFNVGGDEFIFLLKNMAAEVGIQAFTDELFKTIKQPIFIDDNAFHITASGGIVFYPEHGVSFNELLKNADTAMYKSKDIEKGSYMLFNESIGKEALEKATMQSNLRRALEFKEFVLYYQPQLNTKTNKISGFEALIRWNSPMLGIVSPLSFIKAAEDSRLILPIGEWVLEKACKFIKKINLDLGAEYVIAVNISVIQLLNDNFVENVLNILKAVDLNPRFLELEITESVFLISPIHVVNKLERLQAAGINIALDDFGTGYSSLSYLIELPVSILKIDKAFISTMFESQKNISLTSTIIKMGHDLGMELVAEGVEVQKQQEFLTKQKCDRIQGYNVSKPMPEKQLIEFLRKYNTF